MNTHALTSWSIRFAIIFLTIGIVLTESSEAFAQTATVATTRINKKGKRTPVKPQTKIVDGGILNSRATFLPEPRYPDHIYGTGTVEVRVTVDETGKVISAMAVSGHPLLLASSVSAAFKATFGPTKLNGRPVQVTGTLVYNFTEGYRPEVVPPPTEPEKKATIISGGILNGKAISLPQPNYPPVAKAAHASGTVVVQITIDEEGNVISAVAVSGHPLLKAAAVSAARDAKFAPTRLSGVPVKVTGTLHYNFVLPPVETPETPGQVARANAHRGSKRRAPVASRSTFGCPVVIETLPTRPIILLGPTTPVGPPPVSPFVTDDDPPPPPAPIEGGILNSRAISMPRPQYPPVAKAAHASGLVTIKVTVDESGNVIEASAVSGHPLLKAASLGAARCARFNPTLVEGKPVRISGVLLYEFVID